MRRGFASGLAASPTLVGAVTVMIVVLAVFLAYNANTGLPFVPTYALSAEVPNANSLVPGNEVRIGGVRVGLIEAIEPEQNPEDGTVSAKLDLKLDADVEPLPEDSTMIVRARSALGLKYLEIVQGTSERGYPPGATIPISSYGSPDPDDPSQLEEPVEIDEVLSTFDEPTAKAIQENLVEFGNALAGRGPGAQLGARPAAAGAALPRAGDDQPLRPRHRARAVHHRQRRGRVRGRPGRRRPGRAVRQPRHDLHRPGARSLGRSSRRRSPRPRRPSPSPSGRCRGSGPSSTTAPSCSPPSSRAPRR